MRFQQPRQPLVLLEGFHLGGCLLVRVVVLPGLLAGLLGLEVLDLHFRPPLLTMVVVVEWFKKRGVLYRVVTICRKVVVGCLIFMLEFLKLLTCKD